MRGKEGFGETPTAVRRFLENYVHGNPVTAGYLALLLATHAWLVTASAPTRRRLLETVSTNVDNLPRHPFLALAGSALFFDGTLTQVKSLYFVGTLITLGAGTAVCLALLERRYGALRAFVVFAVGHVLATALTAAFIVAAVVRGWYPAGVRDALDYGISYGAEAALAAGAVVFLTSVRRIAAITAVVAWPVIGADFSRGLPDFTTIGHLLAAAIGFALATTLRHRLPTPAGMVPPPGPSL
ncbi:hypothetical protein EDD90_9467 [Streptomyces sp. Ag109_O5-1]|uniref:rhomboid-like protein n=1 Tax=Streptomyces sp. Ag109_O5-1 TaxID=1938851 RepID=UPI000F4D493E|nr:rhomboid-like protein [Streptomyces sp. Ag109_O5-1]RPE46144.1 hypothetical protein EDD90_9467 [Streptomyces sp. Ag109_O5-1]